RSGGIGDITTGSLLQQRQKAVGNGAIGPQQVRERNRALLGVAFEDAGVEPELAAEGGVEARRIDAQRIGDLGHADGLVAAGMKQTLGDGDRLVRIEAPWPTAPTRIFCNGHYRIIDLALAL